MLIRLVKIILIVAITPLAFYFWPTSLGGDSEFFLVSGQSMYPTIQDGSFVITKQSSPYQVGDIVGYYSKDSGINVVHRIIDVDTRGSFIIKGDNNKNIDSGVYYNEDILGEVVFSTPYVGELLTLLRNPVFLMISAIALIAVQMVQKSRKKQKEKLRRIRLGIPRPDPKKQNMQDAKPKKPSYSMFLVAMMLNVITYALLQVGISQNQTLQGDQATGFFFDLFEPSFASTLAFGIYSIFILTLFLVTKNNYQKSLYKTNTSKKSSKTMQVLLGKNVKPVPAFTQFLTFLLCVMLIFHLVTLGPQILPLLNS